VTALGLAPIAKLFRPQRSCPRIRKNLPVREAYLAAALAYHASYDQTAPCSACSAGRGPRAACRAVRARTVNGETSWQDSWRLERDQGDVGTLDLGGVEHLIERKLLRSVMIWDRIRFSRVSHDVRRQPFSGVSRRSAPRRCRSPVESIGQLPRPVPSTSLPTSAGLRTRGAQRMMSGPIDLDDVQELWPNRVLDPHCAPRTCSALYGRGDSNIASATRVVVCQNRRSSDSRMDRASCR